MNEFLLRRVKAAILEQPSGFDMGWWDCKTTACIAGWAMRLSGETQHKRGEEPFPIERAAQLLKLSSVQADKLFYEDRWPLFFQLPDSDDYCNYDCSYDRAQNAAQRIDHFIMTEGLE